MSWLVFFWGRCGVWTDINTHLRHVPTATRQKSDKMYASCTEKELVKQGTYSRRVLKSVLYHDILGDSISAILRATTHDKIPTIETRTSRSGLNKSIAVANTSKAIKTAREAPESSGLGEFKQSPTATPGICSQRSRNSMERAP